jgi:hypothetical protein
VIIPFRITPAIERAIFKIVTHHPKVIGIDLTSDRNEWSVKLAGA